MPRLAKPSMVSESSTPLLSSATSQWLVSLRARNISPRTLAHYEYAMNVVGHVLDANMAVDQVRLEHVEEVVVNLQEQGWKPASVRSVHRAFYCGSASWR